MNDAFPLNSPESHKRFRPAPLRERLSRIVTRQPRFKKCAAALMPINPAPPVMSIRGFIKPLHYNNNGGEGKGVVGGNMLRKKTACTEGTNRGEYGRSGNSFF